MNFFSKTKIFWVVVLGALLVRWVSVGFLQNQRQSPIEVDDAYSYLMHAQTLEVDPRFQSPLMKSFADLQAKMPQENPADFQRNRIYHRIIEFYHSTHALTVWVGLKLGSSPFEIWWGLLYLLQIAFLFPLAFIARDKIGHEFVPIVLACFVLSFGAVAHQMTGAPREWSAAGFFLSLWWWWRVRDRPHHWLNLVVFAGFASIAYGSHSIGKIVFLQFIAIEIWDTLKNRKLRKSFFRILVPGLLVAALVEHSPHWLFGVPTHPSTPMNWVWDGFIGKITLFVNKIFDQLMFLKGIPGLARVSGVLSVFIIIVGATKTDWIRPVLFSALGVQLSFYFISLDYFPAQKWFTFEDYYFTLFYFVLSLAFGCGLKECLLFLRSKFNLKFSSAVVLILISGFVFAGQSRRAGATISGLAKRGSEYQNPKDLVLALESELKARPSCVIVDNEVSLYSLMTFGNYQVSVAFNQYCKDPYWDYRNSVKGSDCEYVFVSETCPSDIKTKELMRSGAQWIGIRAPSVR